MKRRLGRVLWACTLALVGAALAMPVAVAQPARQANAVAIQSFRFEPGELTVPVGTTITWTNHDPVPHTVTARTDLFDSGILNADGSFSFTPGQPGTIEYYCIVHPFMTGTLTVVAATPAAPGAAPGAAPALPAPAPAGPPAAASS